MGKGFQDPNGKYPLKRRRKQPDNPPLSRGISKNTIVSEKDSNRAIGVPIALNGGVWGQPSIPYAAKYPFNHVNETESGHVQEFDDTPGYERIHTYHRTGTFEEIDANGTHVRKIVGDGYVIIDRNGFIYIAGDANVTVTGNINIMCQSDANIEVAGSAEMVVGGSMDMRVARDMNIAVEGDFSVWANGSMNLQSKGNSHIRSNDNLYLSANKDLNVKSDENLYMSSGVDKDMHIRSEQHLYVNAVKDAHLKSKDMYITAPHIMMQSETTDIEGTEYVLTSTGEYNIKQAQGASEAEKALIHGMVPAKLGLPVYPNLEKLISPPLHGEEQMMYETPFEASAAANIALLARSYAQEGKANLYSSEMTVGVVGTGGSGGTIVPGFYQSEILATPEDMFFSYTPLSKNWVLGELLLDGALRPQNGLTVQQIVANLSALAENILEKYCIGPDALLPKEKMGKDWTIGCGFRPGEGRSDHCIGRAVDINLLPRTSANRKEKTFNLIQKLEKIIVYDQLILEYRGHDSVWIHTGIRGDNTFHGRNSIGPNSNRLSAFCMVDDKVHLKAGFDLLG